MEPTRGGRDVVKAPPRNPDAAPRAPPHDFGTSAKAVATQSPQTGAPTGTVAAPRNLTPGRLTLIGAGHVFQIKQAIQESIQAMQPDIVFIELDRARLQGLLNRQQGIESTDDGGFVHGRLAKFQESVAGMYGAQVGDEMLGALQGAQLVGAKLSLIDDAGQDTIARALKELTWKERARALGMLVTGLAKSAIPKNRRNAKVQVENELRRYQEDPQAVMAELQSKFPTIYRVLIAERDAKMATRIRQQLAGARHGVAVLGDGHLNGMHGLLADLNPTVYRLADVREGRLPKLVPTATGTTEKVGFTLNMRVPPAAPDPTAPV